MKTKEMLKELLEIGGEVVLTPLRISKYNLINIDKILLPQGAYYKTTQYLKNEEIISVSEENGVTTIRLTRKGNKLALKYSLDDMKIKKPKKWDQKWRIIIFDVPTKRKSGRLAIQHKLSELGFVMLQKSVYVHPYECFDEIDFIRRIYNIKPFVKYILADDIEDAKSILLQFSKREVIPSHK